MEHPQSNQTATSQMSCHLTHPMFAAMGEILFRQSESDKTPVMVVALGDKQAALPLRSLQREFGIGDETPDGRMLGLIAESLDYVHGLRPGDPLPAEVLTGEASWKPADHHTQLARARLRLQLLLWADPNAEKMATVASIGGQLEDDPDLDRLLRHTVQRVAEFLDLADPNEVVVLVDILSNEMGYIEALREGLQQRLGVMSRCLTMLAQTPRGGGARLDALKQTRQLCFNATEQTARRFAEVDAQTGDIILALRNIDSQKAFIRSNRDTLYRSLRAWEPLLADWMRAGPEVQQGTKSIVLDEIWQLVRRSYQFLAPRYMSFTEWQSAFTGRSSRGGAKPANTMTW